MRLRISRERVRLGHGEALDLIVSETVRLYDVQVAGPSTVDMLWVASVETEMVGHDEESPCDSSCYEDAATAREARDETPLAPQSESESFQTEKSESESFQTDATDL